MESLWDVDRDVLAAILLVFIRRWGQSSSVAICSTLVRCYWCISILIIFPTLWHCSFIGPHSNWPAVVLSDCRYPCFRNFDSTSSVDVIWMKSYMDSFPDRSINLTLSQMGKCPVSLACSEIAEVCVRASRNVSAMFFYPFSRSSPCFSDIHFAAFARNLINNTVCLFVFCWFKGVFRSH